MTEPCGVAYVGRKVLKSFPGHGNFQGTVEKFYGTWKSAPWLVRILRHTSILKAVWENKLSLLIKQAGPLQIRYEDGDSEDLRLQEYGTNLASLFYSTKVSAPEVEQTSFLQVAAHLAAGYHRP